MSPLGGLMRYLNPSNGTPMNQSYKKVPSVPFPNMGSQSRTPRNVILPLASSLQSLARPESGGGHSQVGDTGSPASQLPLARVMTAP